MGALPGKLFHAGTTMKNGKAVSNGGRVLCAVGIGATVKAAQRDAYMIVDAVRIRRRAKPAGHRLSRHRAGIPRRERRHQLTATHQASTGITNAMAPAAP